jgi:hypothetical protein
MRRIVDQNRANQKSKAATAVGFKAVALCSALILFTPAQSLAIHLNVPAQRPQPRTQAAQTVTQTSTGQRQVIVSLPDKQLALLEDGRILKTYQVAVGAEVSRSPEGDFTVINRLENPTYYAPGKVIGPGKDNPLGTRWMGLSKKGFGIHGTNVPSSIGKAASHGCIRMRQRDLEELFAMVQVGDRVIFRDAQMSALLAPLQAPPADAPALAANTNGNTNATPAIVTTDGTDQF